MIRSSPDATAILRQVKDRIARAAHRARRSETEITLIAVSKTHSAAQIRELYHAGLRHFGENRVQEWESKHAQLSDLAATWHMIGHLQGNKAGKVARLFDTVDSLDSASLAERLDRSRNEFNLESAARPEQGSEPSSPNNPRKLRVLIEVKLDPGETKSGVSSEEVAPLVQAVLKMPHLDFRGLMGVPPYFDDPENARPYFRRLRELRDAIRASIGNDLSPVLSMGMSHDFEVAIEEGATEIRVGTALFGERAKV